jgi:glycosyltransferase involved in cell wall biosynthesis
MKILFVNERCGYFNGIEQNIADTAEGLRLRGHQCFLAYGETTERRVTEYQEKFFATYPCAEFHTTKGKENKRNSSQSFAQSFEQIMQTVRPDVVYFHKAPELRRFEKHLKDVRTVRMVHDHDLCCPRQQKYFANNGRVCNQKVGWRCFMDGAFIKRSPDALLGFELVSIAKKIDEMQRNYRLDTLLVGSKFMRDELLLNDFPEDRVYVLPPVVRANFEKTTPVPKTKQILYVGELTYGKGVDLLLKALKQVKCDFTATIVGTGNEKESLEAMNRRLGLAERVKFRGWVSNDQLKAFYDAVKVVVVPSRWPEPFGMMGLEAMRHGRPVVAFSVGGIPDWLHHNHTGVLVPEQDTEAMARALEGVLQRDEFASRLGNNAYDRFINHYAFDDYINRLEMFLGVEQQVLSYAS